MAIYAECDICGKKYRFSDDQGGLTVPCKECTADFEVLKPPFFDRRVLMGVGATIGAIVGLFLIAVVIVEIISATRGPTPVAVTQTPAPGLPRTNVPATTPSLATVPPNQGSSAPVFPSIPKTSPSATAPPSSTPVVPPANVPPSYSANVPRRSFKFQAPVDVPPTSSASVSNTPAVVPNNPGPPVGELRRSPPVLREFHPATITENGELTIRGENLQSVGIIQLFSIRDPMLQFIGSPQNQGDTELTFRVGLSRDVPRGDSDLFVLTMPSVFGYVVTVPKQVVERQEGQPLPKKYESLVYVPPNGHRRVGAGHHVIFVETGATLDLEGTSGQIFLRPGARIKSFNKIGRLQIMADTFEQPANPANHPIGSQTGVKMAFCVIDELVRINKTQ